MAKLGNLDDPLPQESFEGVDEDEWVSERLPGLLHRLEKDSSFLEFLILDKHAGRKW